MNSINMKTPFAYWTNLFTEDELQQLDNYVVNNLQPEQGVVGNGAEISEIRKSTIYWIEYNSDTSWIFDRMNAVGFKLNSHYFGFDITPLQRLQYTLYEEGGGQYDWHIDCFYDSGLNSLDITYQRKLSVVVVCKTAEEGGELELVAGPQPWTTDLPAGKAVAFPSFTLHRVNPIKSGIRKSLVAWFEGPDWR
jgi:PKHD-type hydroxylase